MTTKLYLSSLLIVLFSACAQEESQTYIEQNNSLPSAQEQGYIQTH